MTVKFLKDTDLADYKDPRAPVIVAKKDDELDLRHDLEERLIKAGRAERVKGRRRRAPEPTGEEGGGEGGSEGGESGTGGGAAT